MRHAVLALGVLTIAAVSPLRAQDPAPPPPAPSQAKPLPVDVKKLVPHRDSMSVLVNNQPMGTNVWSLGRGGDSIVIHELTVIGTALVQETTVNLTKSAEVVRVNQSGMIRGVEGGIHIAYNNDHVTGNVQAVTATGPAPFTVDTTVPPGTMDDNAVMAMLPALPWAKDAGWNFWMYSAGSNSVSEMVLYVVAEETAMVPAGAFAAYRARLLGGSTNVDFLILKREPHTVLKVEMSGAPLKYELISGGGL